MTRSKAAALAMVCTGASIDQIATKLGKSPRTIRRWVRSPDFATAIADAHAESVERCGAMLAAVGPAMLAAVVKIAQDETAPAGARLAAARDLLDRLGVGVRPSVASDEDDYEHRLAPINVGWKPPAGDPWVPNEKREPDPESIN